MIERLFDGRVFLNYGPIQMVLDIYRAGEKVPALAEEVAAEIIEEYLRLIPMSEIIKKREAILDESFTGVARKMVAAVSKINDEQLTPMAAVAGSFSEYALECAQAAGASKIIINNGGDLAVLSDESEPLYVGVPLYGETNQYVRIRIDSSSEIQGICTSGLGGRSFTKGVATAVVVTAPCASIADAAATHIANQTNFEPVGKDPITRCYAEEIDFETDINGQLVTVKADSLTSKEACMALLNGVKAAEIIHAETYVKGALLMVQDELAVWPDEMLEVVDFTPMSGAKKI